MELFVWDFNVSVSSSCGNEFSQVKSVD